jgi:hypothetical protein
VIVAIRTESEYRSYKSYRTYISERAASGSPLAARFTGSLKIIVEHSSMTNQTHLFRHFHGCRPDQGATPRTDYVVRRWLFTVLRMNTFTQFDLPD